MFEVHVEKQRILSNLDLSSAIASLLHLAFVFNIKYPKVMLYIRFIFSNTLFQESQTLGDILQRLVARYGDESGK